MILILIFATEMEHVQKMGMTTSVFATDYVMEITAKTALMVSQNVFTHSVYCGLT